MAKVEDSVQFLKFLTSKFDLSMAALRGYIEGTETEEDPAWTINQVLTSLEENDGIMVSQILNNWELLDMLVLGESLRGDFSEAFADLVEARITSANFNAENTLVVVDEETFKAPGFELPKGVGGIFPYPMDKLKGKPSKGDDFVDDLLAAVEEAGIEGTIDNIVVYSRLTLTEQNPVKCAALAESIASTVYSAFATPCRLILVGNATDFANVNIDNVDYGTLVSSEFALGDDVKSGTPMGLFSFGSDSSELSYPNTLGFFSMYEDDQTEGHSVPYQVIKTQTRLFGSYLHKVGAITASYQPPCEVIAWVSEQAGLTTVSKPLPGEMSDDTKEGMYPLTVKNADKVLTYLGCAHALAGKYEWARIDEIMELSPRFKVLQGLAWSLIRSTGVFDEFSEVMGILENTWNNGLRVISPAEAENLWLYHGKSQEAASSAMQAVKNQIAVVAPSVCA